MFNEAQNLLLVRTELDTVFFQNFDYDETEPGIATSRTGDLFREISIDRLSYIGAVNKGTGLWGQTAETQTVPLENPSVGNKYVTNVLDYTNSIEISKNLFDDMMHDVWSEDVRNFAMMARVTQDANAFGIFRNAFTTVLTPDGSPLAGTHTLLGGGTVSNVISGALTTDTLNVAVTALREQKNQNGIILGGSAAWLVVPPVLLKKAVEITDSVLIADSGNNAINFYRSMLGIRPVSSPYLGAPAGGSDTAWFLLSRNHAIRRIIRQGVQTALRDWSATNNRTYLYQGNFREVMAAYDYAGFIASTGL